MTLWARAPNATYSDPVLLCGDDAPVVSLEGSENIACTSAGLTQDGNLIEKNLRVGETDVDRTSKGCSVSHGSGHSRSNALGILIGALLLRTLRRRHAVERLG